MTAGPLPRASASSLGIDEGGVLSLLDAAEARGVRMRSLLVVRHGFAGVELVWPPDLPDQLVHTHSLTKSVVAMVAGRMARDGLLSEDDRVLDLLPGTYRSTPDPTGRLGRLRVGHLLSMTSGHLSEPPKQGVDDEVTAFLETPMEAEPGERFFYTSAGVNALSAILEHVGGASLRDLLSSYVLEPIGICDFELETCASGRGKGSGGLSLTTEGMCRLGQLLLQGGRWEGRQVVPEAWARRMGSVEVETPLMAAPAAWTGLRQGYGLLTWGCPDAGARVLYGLNGQFVIVLDEFDAVVVTTAAEPAAGRVLDLVAEFVVPAISPDGQSRTSSAGSSAELATRAASLPSTWPLSGKTEPLCRTGLWKDVNGMVLELPDNRESMLPEGFLRHIYTTRAAEAARRGIARLELAWDGANATISYEESGVGGTFSPATSGMPSRHSLRTPWGSFDVLAQALWEDERTLALCLRPAGSEYWQTVLVRPFGEGPQVAFSGGPSPAGATKVRTYPCEVA